MHAVTGWKLSINNLVEAPVKWNAPGAQAVSSTINKPAFMLPHQNTNSEFA